MPEISVKLSSSFCSIHPFIYSVSCITRLEEKRAEFEKRGMRLSQICSVGEPLRLGRLQGNHFDLVVRDLRPHGAGDTHSSGANTHTRLAALIKEAVENVEVVFSIYLFFFSTLHAYNSAHCHTHVVTLTEILNPVPI